MTQSVYQDQLKHQLEEAQRDRRAAEDELARLRPLPAQLAEAQAALAALHEGEEPHEDENVVPTPGQWIWRWNHGTPEQRLLWAHHVIDAIDTAHTCTTLAFHKQRIAELSHGLNATEDELDAVRRRLAGTEAERSEVAKLSHQYRNAAERAEARIAAVRELADQLIHTGSHAAGNEPRVGGELLEILTGTTNQPATPPQLDPQSIAGWPGAGPVPTIAAVIELAERARAAHQSEQQHVESSIRVTAWVAGLTVHRTEPVEQIAGAPAVLDRLTAAITELARETAPTRAAGLVSWLTSLPSLPLVPDEELPPGVIHLRPHPRPADGPVDARQGAVSS